MPPSTTYGPKTGVDLSVPKPKQLFDPNQPDAKKNFLMQHGYNEGQAQQLMMGGNPMAPYKQPSPEERRATAQQAMQPKKIGGVGMGPKGALVHPDTLEKLRSSGVPDDEIADSMALSSPKFADQLRKIRKATSNDPDATTAYLNSRFYGDTSYDPTKPQQKNALTKALDYIYSVGTSIYDTAQNDILGEGGTINQYTLGEISLGDALIRTPVQIYGAAASPVLKPSADATVGAARGIIGDENLQYALEGAMESQIGQKIGGAVQSYNDLPPESNWRNVAAVGKAGLDTLGVLGTQATLDVGKRGLSQLAHPVQTLRHPIQAAKYVYSGKQATEAARAATEGVSRELTGAAKKAVDKGMDQKFMEFVAEQNPETKAVMSKMTRAANDGSKLLGGTVKHKEILGGQMMDNLGYVIDKKNVAGNALGAMKSYVADDIFDLTDDFDDFLGVLRDKGAVINDKYQITSLAGASDDNIPLLQKTLDFFADDLDDAGNVSKFGRDIDQWRTKMFQEMNSAKAKLQPSSAGQSALGFSEKATNDVRRAALVRMARDNPYMIAQNDAFEELATETSKFLKAINYKGKLTPEAITAKDLKAGEIALRTLGNSSADTRDAFVSMLNTAKKYGRVSNVDDMALVRYADALEDVFPITPTRSLAGQVTRATKDAGGNVVDDVAQQVIEKKGFVRGAIGYADKKALDVWQSLRGITPENRFKLLMEVLDAPPDTPFFTVVKDALPDEVADDIGREATKGVTAGDMKPVAQSEIDDLMHPSTYPVSQGRRTPQAGASPSQGSQEGLATGQPGPARSGKVSTQPSTNTMPQKPGLSQAAAVEGENRVVGLNGPGLSSAEVMGEPARAASLTPAQIAAESGVTNEMNTLTQIAVQYPTFEKFADYVRRILKITALTDEQLNQAFKMAHP